MWHIPWMGNPLRAVPCHHIQTASSRRHRWCQCARLSQACRGRRPLDPASKPRISPLCCRLSCEWQARWLKPAPHSLQGKEKEGRWVSEGLFVRLTLIYCNRNNCTQPFQTNTKTSIHYNQDKFKRPLRKQADHGKKKATTHWGFYHNHVNSLKW